MSVTVDLRALIQERRISVVETHVALDRAFAALQRSRDLLDQTGPLVDLFGGARGSAAVRAAHRAARPPRIRVMRPGRKKTGGSPGV